MVEVATQVSVRLAFLDGKSPELAAHAKIAGVSMPDWL
jgi:hypothetical protein